MSKITLYASPFFTCNGSVHSISVVCPCITALGCVCMCVCGDDDDSCHRLTECMKYLEFSCCLFHECSDFTI